MVLLLAALIFAVILYRWISQERLQYFAPREAVTTSPTPEPTPTRPPPIAGKLDIGRLFNGITLHSSVETAPGVDASTERVDPDSYVLDLRLKARVRSFRLMLYRMTVPMLPTFSFGLRSPGVQISMNPPSLS